MKKAISALIVLLMVGGMAYGQTDIGPATGIQANSDVVKYSKEGNAQPDNTLQKAGTKSATSCTTVTFGGVDNYYYGGEAAAQYSVSYTYYNYSHTQFIIRRSEMEGFYNATCGAMIYKISFFISDSYGDVGNSFTRKWTISMGHTSNNQFNNSTYLTGLTTVLSTRNITFSGEGWVDIELSTPFSYNGTQNLVIDVKDNTGSYLSGSYPIFGCVESLTGSAINNYSDYSSDYNSSIGSSTMYRPYCRLCISPRSTLTYNTNGDGNCGTSTSIPSVSCTDEVTLPSTIPSAGGGTFAYWSQYPDGYGTQFQPDQDVYLPASDVTLYAIYLGSLTYNTTYNCPGGGTATSIAPVENRQVAHVTSVIPTCTSTGSFRYWNTAPDGSGTTYAAGDEVRLDCLGDVTLYAIYCDETYTLTLDNCSQQVDDTCYIDVCLPTSGTSNVTLSAITDMPNPTFRWSVNEHDGNGYTASTGATRSISVSANDEPMGYDIQVTAQSAQGCKASAYGRIRTSHGLNATANHSFEPICAGSGNTITIGTAPGADITIDEPAVHIEAQLGQGVQTFIPDGPNCTSLGQCYTSSVEFRDFEPDAVVDAATDIDYLRINLEHSFIGDLQIKLICPNGQNSIILQDHDNALDPDVYNWPYMYAFVWGASYRYANNGTAGNCVRGTYDGAYYQQYYVIRNGSTYTLTGDQNQATLFAENELTNALMTTIYNQTSGTTSVPDWCTDNYYYEFYGILPNSDGSTHGKTFLGVGFGNPNRNDNTDDHICDAAYNPVGTGLDYCWSGNPEYSYASGHVYSAANHTASDGPNPYVTPSNEANHSNFYHPFEDFSSLIGCPLNGTWTVQVCDSWAIDNGYIFNWSLALSDSKLPNSWGYTIETANSDFNCASGSITHTIDPVDHSVEIDPQLGDNGTGCNIIITDNIGCETVVNVPLVVEEPTIIASSSNLETQDVCQGSGITTNIWTIGGIATGATIEWSPSTPAGINFAVSGTTVTLSGSNVTADANTYYYTITTVQASGCDPVTAIGSITVNPQPAVTVTAVGNQCPGGQTVTVTGTLTASGTAPYNYSWNLGTLEAANGTSSTIDGSTSTTPTVDVVIPGSPCNANYQIGLTVTDDKQCSYTFTPTNIITVADNGGPTIINGQQWPDDQLGNHESYPGVDNILTRVPTTAVIAALYEDDCTMPVNVTQGTPIVDSAADCGWGVRVPYTISDNCDHSFTSYINITGGDNNFTNAPWRDSIVSCPSQLPTEAQMRALVPQITICGVTQNVELDSIRDNIDQSCGNRIYYYHYLDANGEPYVWAFTFYLEHSARPAEQGTPVPTSSSVACIADAVPPTMMPQIRDACGNLLEPVNSTTEEYSNNCNGFRKYIYTYVDCDGHDTTWTYTYRIHDSIPPTINPIAQQNALPASNCQYKMPDLRPLTVASDLCCGDNVTFMTQSPDTNERFDQTSNPQTITVTVTVADACGNPATRQVSVVIPANSFSVTAPGDVTVCPNRGVDLTAQSNDNSATYSWTPASWLSGTNGNTVTASPGITTTYTVVATSASGCRDTDDVTVFVNSQVHQSSSIQTVHECVSYTWIDGHTYTSSTNNPTYVYHNGNVAGCDSTVTLHLTIHDTVSVETTEHYCDQYTTEGVTYVADTDFVQELHTQWNCDSTVTLHLKIHPSYSIEDFAIFCQGGQYVYHGDTLTAPGEYSKSYQSIYGCDSNYTLVLNMRPIINLSIDTTIDCINGWFEFVVSASPSGDYQYHWTSKPLPGSVSSIAMYRYTDQGYGDTIHAAPDKPTTFYVTAGYGDDMLCPQTDSINVDEFVMPTADFEVTPPHVTADMPNWYATYNLHGDRHTVSREWYVDNELYDQQSQHIYGEYDLRSGNDSVIIELIAYGKFCSDTARIAIPYIQESLYIPNVFTPGLETNNLFGAEGTGILEFEMWVFNREGLVVFHGTSLDEKWDGKHNGTDCAMSSYTYRVIYRLERTPNSYDTKVGTIMLLR